MCRGRCVSLSPKHLKAMSKSASCEETGRISCSLSVCILFHSNMKKKKKNLIYASPAGNSLLYDWAVLPESNGEPGEKEDRVVVYICL